MKAELKAPWSILQGNETWIGGVVISDSDGNHIATAHKGKHNAETMAHLIAAAPDMYEALKGILPMLEGEYDGHPSTMAVIEALMKADGELGGQA